MRKLAFLLLGLTLAAAPVRADPVCDMGGATAYPVLENVKARFLAGDWDAFSADVTRLMSSDSKQGVDDALASLAKIVPDGFDGCSTVVQRVDSGGLVQEVTGFTFPGAPFPIAVYLLAMPVRGRLEIAQFNFNTSFGRVIENLR